MTMAVETLGMEVTWSMTFGDERTHTSFAYAAAHWSGMMILHAVYLMHK
jgi:hypothetical protein